VKVLTAARSYNNDMEKTKPPLWERTANFFEKLHYGIGAVALAGFAAESATGIALVRPDILLLVAAYEGLHGLAINAIKNWFKNRGKSNSSPKLDPS
jgi:hypothetical protein